MCKQETIDFFHKQIAKEHMAWWKFKQEIEKRMDLFTTEKEKLIEAKYKEYKAKESEYIDIIEFTYYEDMANEVPIYNR